MSVQDIVDWAVVFFRRVNFQFITGGKGFRYVTQRHPILRTFWPRQARLDGPHIQFKCAGKYRFIARVTPHPLRFGIRFNQRHLLFATATQAHIFQRDSIDGEKAAGCAILRRHVGDGGTVGKR